MAKLTSKEREALSKALYDRFDQMSELAAEGSISKSEYVTLDRAMGKLQELFDVLYG